MFALVLGAASCAQDSTPSGTEPSGSESSGTDINGATDNNNTNSGGTQNSTPSGSNPSGHNPSGHKPSGTKPEGTDIKDVIDSEDFSGTWKLTDAYCYIHNDYDGYYDKEYTTPEEVRDVGILSSILLYNNDIMELTDDFCIEFSNDFLQSLAAPFEEPQEPTLDGCLKVNGNKNEIYYYIYQLANFGTTELSLTFTKQQ